jgi:hypothetical protein
MYVLCILLLNFSYMFRCNRHPQGASTNIIKTHNNEIVLQGLCLSNVHVLVTERYETIQLNRSVLEPAGYFKLDCVGLVSNVITKLNSR